MKNKISVIITTYGRSYDSISRSIESVLKQTYKNFEIILVDDNGLGTSYQREIAEKVSNIKKLIYIAHSTNMGAQKARNTGIKNSSGTIIAFLDDDDEWEASKLAEQEKEIKDNVGLVFSMGKTVYEETNEITDYIPPANFKKKVTFNDLLYSDYIGTTTQAMIPKYVFDKVGDFDINQPARQDYEMWIRISREYDCLGITIPLFKHYVHKGEQISKSNTKGLIGLQNIYCKYKNDYKKNATASFHINYMIARKYINKRNYFKGFTHLLASLLFFIKSFFLEHKKFKYYIMKGYKKYDEK